MLHLLDEGLEAFLRSAVPLPTRDVDVSFDAPDRDWAARLTRPTVNLYLWDVRRNLDQRDGGLQLRDGGDGRPTWLPPLPRLDCRYLVTAWTSDVRDAHSLLGAVVQVLLATTDLAAEHLPPGYAEVRPLPGLRLADNDGRSALDLLTALGAPARPGVDLTVTATADAVPSWPAGPPVDTVELGLTLRAEPPKPQRGKPEERDDLMAEGTR